MRKKKAKKATINRLMVAIDKINAAARDPALESCKINLQEAARLVYAALQVAESQ